MARTLAVLMDAITDIRIAKDTSFALLLEAQRRGYQIRYMTQGDLAIRDGIPMSRLAGPARDRRRPGAQGSAGRCAIHL